MSKILIDGDVLKEALRQAWNLGQTYWAQADSDLPKQWRKADVTQEQFNKLIEETLAQPEQDPMIAAMSHVADEYAHRLALDLECVLADYNGQWWDKAMQTIGGYRTAMNAIHEQVSPTHMGEPLVKEGGAR